MPQFTLTKYILRLGVQMNHKQSEIRVSCIFHLKTWNLWFWFFFNVMCLRFASWLNTNSRSTSAVKFIEFMKLLYSFVNLLYCWTVIWAVNEQFLTLWLQRACCHGISACTFSPRPTFDSLCPWPEVRPSNCWIFTGLNDCACHYASLYHDYLFHLWLQFCS